MNRTSSDAEVASSDLVGHRREIGLLTALCLELQDRNDLLRSQLFEERSRRLRDLADLHALDRALAESEAVVDEARALHVLDDLRLVELTSRLDVAHTRIAQLSEAHTAEAWSPHVMRLRTQWRRLPAGIRLPVHKLLAAGERAMNR